MDKANCHKEIEGITRYSKGRWLWLSLAAFVFIVLLGFVGYLVRLDTSSPAVLTEIRSGEVHIFFAPT